MRRDGGIDTRRGKEQSMNTAKRECQRELTRREFVGGALTAAGIVLPSRFWGP